ncbi:MAG: response regulator [Candidatus Pacebacteria bacterium]|nr:response regulator [Candidatus Paceibacterota bacterium]
MAKILVLDDEEGILKVFLLILSKLGHKVSAVEKGEDALKKIENGEIFDLAIFDIENPFLGAKEIIKRVKEFAPGLKVIVMSGRPHEEVMENPKKHGFFSSLQKPLDYDKIKPAVEGALSNDS